MNARLAILRDLRLCAKLTIVEGQQAYSHGRLPWRPTKTSAFWRNRAAERLGGWRVLGEEDA